MAPRLRVLAGTSSTSMTPITPLVNTSRAHYVSSPLFEGRIVVHIKGMTDEKGRVRGGEYFERGDNGNGNGRAGVTWSIQVQGRFLVPYSADDILFGNTFDRPLKLPWGTSAVLKFMHYIDPTLEHDLTSSSKPWALSPLIATMPHFMHKRLSPADVRSGKAISKMPAFPTREPIGDDTRELYLALADEDCSSGSGGMDGEGGGEVEEEVGEDDGEGEYQLEGQRQAPLMVTTRPPVLIPGPVPPIPAMSSGSLLGRNGSVSTMTSTSTSSTRRSSSLSVASSSSSSSGLVSGSAGGLLDPLSSGNAKMNSKAKGKRSQPGSSRLSVSSSLSTSSSSSTSSSGSGASGSVASGTGSSSVVSVSTNNTHNSGGTSKSTSTRSSGLSSIRMKTKDVVRKVKGKKSAPGGGGSDVAREARRRKEEELKTLGNASQRRTYFASKERRKDVVFGPEDVITTDFCYGFISFAPSLALQLPGGLSFDLMKYWDGQPVRFVCCERPGISTSQPNSKEPWGRIFWCMAIEIVDDGEDDEEGEGEQEE